MWTGIELLHILQDIRLEYTFLEDFFLAMSSKATYLVIPMALIFLFYLCINKKQAEFLTLSYAGSLFSFAAKYWFNEPRPWDLDPTIIEVKGANADGLSLPSGHTSSAISFYLPAAVLLKDRRIISAIMIIAMLLIVMARLVLCVHTPLDVIVGAIVAIVSILIAWKAIDYAYDDDRAYHLVNAAYVVFFTTFFILSIVCFNGDVKELSVFLGFFYGMFIGRTLDRLYLRYEIPQVSVKTHALRYVAGVISGVVLLIIPALLSHDWGIAIGGGLLMFWLFFGYPYIITKKQLFC